ncbi:hypothetical protein GYMLUDRAFT_46673 [Collybiopsis luxurians FD-317 M1]|uniref:Unplaced genomic scaffold GYMLUscaffold_45, whole genome shotgun sequence n=1 Tax=Collybiopsis luxurians FD-317 M1 TaxID=944289 RepID=A0A0D0CG15_9AGAR|nr:hypothetical protein GYMLUDRAFT_46673 [Collybiopsis luxurians FD-317 M1]
MRKDSGKHSSTVMRMVMLALMLAIGPTFGMINFGDTTRKRAKPPHTQSETDN